MSRAVYIVVIDYHNSGPELYRYNRLNQAAAFMGKKAKEISGQDYIQLFGSEHTGPMQYLEGWNVNEHLKAVQS